MCGIAGYVNVHNPPRRFDLSVLGEALKHRGPDSTFFLQKEDFGFVVRRLSIIDVKNGTQPYTNETNSIYAIFNGQIYNFPELRDLVLSKGHSLSSNSDGEIIPHLFEIFGPSFITKLDGMFAIAIWVNEHSELYLFRDRAGEKPLIYSILDGNLVFASEMKALINLDLPITQNIDRNAVADFLTFGYVPSPKTIFEGVFKLPPAHMLIFKDQQVRIQRYWQATKEPKIMKIESQLDLFDSLLNESVQARLQSERPLGSFLSGGLDSSLIAYIASMHLKEPLRTFSIGFENTKFDETIYAQEASRVIGSQHKTFRLSNSDSLHLFEENTKVYDEPFGDSSGLATIALSKLASNDIVVALSGDGGDEIFGGYRRYQYVKRYSKLQPLFKALSTQSLVDSKFIPIFPDRLKKLFSPINKEIPEFMYFQIISQLDNINLEKLIKKSYSENLASPINFYTNFMKERSSLHSLEKAVEFDFAHYLPDDLLYKMDMASMSASLEVRSPFLDHKIIEFGRALLLRESLQNDGKSLLKVYAERFFPQKFVYRKKMGFGIPKIQWLKTSLKKECDEIFQSKNSQVFTILDHNLTKAIYDDFVLRSRHGNFIWNLLILEKWLQRWN